MDESCIKAGPLVSRLKHIARRLHRRVDDGDAQARSLVSTDGGEAIQRRHCLKAVAQRVGFSSWAQARCVLEREDASDRGTFMFRESGGAISNIWSASYAEAKEIHAGAGGFLLPYRTQFQVVQASYVKWLGLDPVDRDWDVMGRDWLAPTDEAAWARIAGRRLDVLLDGWAA